MMLATDSVQDDEVNPMAEPENTRPPNSDPSPKITLTSYSEYACYSPSSKHKCWAVISLKAPFYEPNSRADVDIVAVIDRSGSMTGPKIALVKKTLLFVIDQLKDSDRFSLVVYDASVDLVFNLMKMTKENKEHSKTIISSINTGASTNLCGGLLKGMQQITLTKNEETRAQVQSVLLLTDGLANWGITSQGSIINQMKLMQKRGLWAVHVSIPNDHSPQVICSSALTRLFSFQNPVNPQSNPIRTWPEHQLVQVEQQQAQPQQQLIQPELQSVSQMQQQVCLQEQQQVQPEQQIKHEKQQIHPEEQQIRQHQQEIQQEHQQKIQLEQLQIQPKQTQVQLEQQEAHPTSGKRESKVKLAVSFPQWQEQNPASIKKLTEITGEQTQVQSTTDEHNGRATNVKNQIVLDEQWQALLSTQQQLKSLSTDTQKIWASTGQQEASVEVKWQQTVGEAPKVSPKPQPSVHQHPQGLPMQQPSSLSSTSSSGSGSTGIGIQQQMQGGIPQQRQVSFAQMSYGPMEKFIRHPSPNGQLKFDGTVYAFGFGEDHSATMLEAISSQGGGMYYNVDSIDKIPQCFADCLGGLLSVVGQNVTLRLAVHGNCRFKRIHASRPVKWVQPKKSCEIALGDIQSEESRDLVLELELPPISSDNATENVPLVSIDLSYFNVITSQFDTLHCQLITNRTDGDPGEGNVKVDAQRNRVLVAKSFKEAQNFASQNKLEEARNSISHTLANMAVSSSRNDELTQHLIRDSTKSLGVLESETAFNSSGRHFISNRSQSHSMQRSNYVDHNNTPSDAYVTSSRCHLQEMAKKHNSTV